jgi:hypothetical protein
MERERTGWGPNSPSSFYATILYEMAVVRLRGAGELIDSAAENMRGVGACTVMNGMGYMHGSRAKGVDICISRPSICTNHGIVESISHLYVDNTLPPPIHLISSHLIHSIYPLPSTKC